MDLIVEPLNTAVHDRNSFDCGIQELNLFLQQQANQNQHKHISKTHVAVAYDGKDPFKKIYGFYTLSAGQIHITDLPGEIRAKIPRYPIPIVRIGRLAVDKAYRKQGIGGFLLFDAFSKVLTIADQIGLFSVVVDAKNQAAKAFYQGYGFSELQDSTLTLFLTLNTIKEASGYKN